MAQNFTVSKLVKTEELITEDVVATSLTAKNADILNIRGKFGAALSTYKFYVNQNWGNYYPLGRGLTINELSNLPPPFKIPLQVGVSASRRRPGYPPNVALSLDGTQIILAPNQIVQISGYIHAYLQNPGETPLDPKFTSLAYVSSAPPDNFASGSVAAGASPSTWAAVGIAQSVVTFSAIYDTNEGSNEPLSIYSTDTNGDAVNIDGNSILMFDRASNITITVLQDGLLEEFN